MPAEVGVMRLGEVDCGALHAFLARFRLELAIIADNDAIPGSFWGETEAGLVGAILYARRDTPLHSALHESGHFVCMDGDRRRGLDTNAGGDYDEENAVCYWQILAAGHVPGAGAARMCADMDAWGYTFRLGSAAEWFAHDADDARAWLAAAGLIDADSGALCFGVRQ